MQPLKFRSEIIHMIQSYRESLWLLRLDRPLPINEEVVRCAQLQKIWECLSGEEQAQIELENSIVPAAPEDLNMIDREAKDGVVPRISA